MRGGVFIYTAFTVNITFLFYFCQLIPISIVFRNQSSKIGRLFYTHGSVLSKSWTVFPAFEASMKFELDNTDGKARRGRLIFDRGVVETPAFMPVGTYGTVKGMTPEELKGTGAEICLGQYFSLNAASRYRNH